MATQSISNLLKIGARTIFIQESVGNPAAQPFYRGESSFGGFNVPLGDINPIYLPSREQVSKWDIVDMTQGAEGLATSDMTSRVNLTLYRKLRDLKNKRCPFVAYVKGDDCGRPDDLRSWQYILAYINSRFSDFTDAASNPLQGDDEAAVELSFSISAQKEIEIYPIKFEEVADTVLLADAIDGFYSSVASCGGRCGEAKDECHNLYVLQVANSGSPGLSSQLVRSLDDKQTWAAMDIPPLGGVSATAMEDAGSYIIVVSSAKAAHYYIRFSDVVTLTTAAWASLTTNYAVGQGLWDVWAKSPEEIYIAGGGGYAYKLSTPTAAPTILTDGSIVTANLKHVGGWASTVVFAGDTGKVLVSVNDGESLTEKAVSVSGVANTGNITALVVTGENTWFLAIAGALYYTIDGGTTYTAKPVNSAITVINDIRFDQYGLVGYLAAEANGAARVYRTWDGGYSWQNTAPEIEGLPTAVRINFVAPCGANEVAVGGRVSVGGDGVLAIAG